MNNKISYRGLPKQRRFGTELEVKKTVSGRLIQQTVEANSDRRSRLFFWCQSICNNAWHIKEDLTCGWEIASFVGRGGEDVLHMGRVSQALLDAGCEVNEDCGLHVHVEACDFSTLQIGVLMAHYAKFEWMILQLLPECRNHNPYCLTLFEEFDYKERYKQWSPEDLWLRLKPKSLAPLDNPCRHRSVNLVNYTKKWRRKTVEFRLPNCSLAGEDTRNWIRLFVNFVEWVKRRRMPRNLNSVGLAESLSYMGLGEDYFLGRDLLETKTWFLRKIIKAKAGDPRFRWLLLEAKKILKGM